MGDEISGASLGARVGISGDKQRELFQGRGGVGLRGMRERMVRLGGDFAIQSTGKGTTITAALPRET